MFGLASTTPIGIEIREKTIRAAQFRVRGDRRELVAATTEPIEPAEDGAGRMKAVYEALEAIARGGEFSGDEARSVLPREQVGVRPFMMEAEGAADDSLAAQEAAAAVLPFPAEEAAVNFMPLANQPEVKDGRTAGLLVYSRHEDINRHLALFREAELDCVGLDLAPLAAARALPASPGASVMLDVDAKSTSAWIFDEGELVFSRLIPRGSDEFIAAAARGLDIMPFEAEGLLRRHGIGRSGPRRADLEAAERDGTIATEALSSTLFEVCSDALERWSRQVSRALAFHAERGGGSAVRAGAIVGDASVPGLADWLGSRLGIEITVGDPLGSITQSTHADGVPGSGAYAVAAGLAVAGETP